MMDVQYLDSSELITVVKFRKHAYNETLLLAVAESNGTINLFDASTYSPGV